MPIFKIKAENGENCFSGVVSFIITEKSSEQLMAFSKNMISDYERRVFSSFDNEKRKKSYLMGRISAKSAVGEFENELDPKSVSIENDVFGKPLIVGADKYNVSISHTESLGAAAVFDLRFPVCLGVEKFDPRNMEMEKSMLTFREKMMLDFSSFINEQDVILTVLWTAKEALGKLLGTGLKAEKDVLEISEVIENDGCFTCKFSNFSQFKSFSWRSSGYVCTLIYSEEYNIEITESGENSYDLKEYCSYLLSSQDKSIASGQPIYHNLYSMM